MFRTFDPYYDYDEEVNTQQIEKIEKIEKIEECFICYEIKLDNNIEPIRLKMQLLYLKNCECDGNIHKQCLDMWFNLKKSCPICRNLIIKNNSILINFMSYHKVFILTYIFYKKNIYKIKKFLFVIFTTCLIINLYFQILNIKYKNKYNNKYYMNDDYTQYNNFVNLNPSINYIIPLNISSKMNPNYHN